MKNLLLLVLSVFVFNIAYTQKSELADADNQYRALQFVQALQTLNNVIDAYPDLGTAYMQRARVHGALGNEKAKDLDIEMANYLNPYSHLMYSSLDRSRLLAKKKYGYTSDSGNDNKTEYTKSPLRADIYLEMLEDSDQQRQDSIIQLSIQQILAQDYDAAVDNLESLEGSGITDNIALDLLGVISMKQGNYEDAISYFDEVIANDPDFVIAYHNRSICHKQLGDYQAASEDLNAAIELNGDFAHFYFTKALLSERLDDDKAALANYEKAIDKRPQYTEALVNYSVLLKSLGEFEYAISAMDKVIAINPDKPKNLFLRGNVNLIYGSYEQAIDDFDDYLLLNANDPKAVFNKGVALVLNGEINDGCKYLRRSESLGLEKSADFIEATCD